MRVVHVINHLVPAGAEGMLVRLVTRAQDRGVTSEVISLRAGGELADQLRQSGTEVTELGLGSWASLPVTMAKLAERLRHSRGQVVQTWQYHANLIGGVVARATGAGPVAWNLRHGDLDPAVLPAGTIVTARACAPLSRRLPDVIVCCSHATALTHRDLGYDRDRFMVIQNGFDLERFRPRPEAAHRLRSELGVGPDTVLVGYVARFSPQKDHATFLGALQRLPERVHGVLVGSGADHEKGELSALIDRAGLGNRVHVLGNRQDVAAITAGFDIAAMTARSGEGFPNVLGEAMACGIPCITTDVGDARGIIGGTGWVVPRRDPEALSRALDAVLEEDRAALGRAARSRVAALFSLDDTVTAYESLWSRLAAGEYPTGQSRGSADR